MKKIFLLTLLSVFLLSAYSQTPIGAPEIIYQASFNKSVDDDEIQLSPFGVLRFLRLFFYKDVIIEHVPFGIRVTCTGIGSNMCIPPLTRDAMPEVIGVAPELMARSSESIINEYDEKVASGVPVGLITKKIAYSDPLSGGRTAYLIFQVNWNHAPQNLYNGTAEITITKTDNLGF